MNNCTFERNNAGQEGGALYLDSCDFLELTNIILNSNYAPFKGVIYIQGQTMASYKIDGFSCENNIAEFGTCIYQIDGEISLYKGKIITGISNF